MDHQSARLILVESFQLHQVFGAGLGDPPRSGQVPLSRSVLLVVEIGEGIDGRPLRILEVAGGPAEDPAGEFVVGPEIT